MEKKRLLFIYYKLFKPGGITRVLTNLVNELAEEYDITILVLMAKHEPFYALHENVKIEYIDSFSHWGFRKINVNLDKFAKPLPKRRNIQNYVYDFGVYSLLKDWLNKNHEKFDTIVTCMFKLSAQAAMSKAIRHKTIAWEHTDHRMGGIFFKRILQKYGKNLKAIVAINSISYAYYKGICPSSQLIPNIIGDPFESLEVVHSKENLISYVGRLDQDKNVLELLEILKESDFQDNWTFQIIGDGPDRKNLEKFVNENSMRLNVRFLGSQTPEQIVVHLQKSKIFSFTSKKEAFAMVLVEAMFCGNALVSYDCEFGPADIISERNGYLIPMHDKIRFKQALNNLTQNPDKLQELNLSSYQEAQKWKKQKWIDFWRKMI